MEGRKPDSETVTSHVAPHKPLVNNKTLTTKTLCGEKDSYNLKRVYNAGVSTGKSMMEIITKEKMADMVAHL